MANLTDEQFNRREELKNKIQAAIIDYCNENIPGFRDGEQVSIKDHLKPLWQSLRDQGLLVPGMHFLSFQRYALMYNYHAEMDRQFRETFGKFGV